MSRSMGFAAIEFLSPWLRPGLSRSTHWWARCAGISLILMTLSHPAKAQEVSFAPVVHYTVIGSVYEIALCDVNGDGFPDILTELQGSTRLGVLINDGAGGFMDLELILGVLAVGSITCGDIDGDGDNDIVTAASAERNYVVLNDGHGLFTVVPGPITTTSVSGRDSVVACDFDSDGDLDLVFATGFDSNPKQLELFRNIGHGRFRPGVTMPFLLQFSNLETGVACVDLDGNGHDDVVGFANSHRSFSVLFNDGLGGLSRTAVSDLGYPRNVAFGELDGTPGLDAVLVSRLCDAHPGRLRMLRNTGNGVLSEWLDYGHTIAGRPTAIAVGRFNTDALDDVVVTDAVSQLAMILLPVPEGFEHVASFAVGHIVHEQIVSVDVNGDGLDDLVIPGGGASVVSVLINLSGDREP